MINSCDKLILRIEERSSTELKKHLEGPGKRYVFSDHKNNPEGKIYAIVRVVKNVDNSSPHVEIHSHDVDSLWMFIGDGEGLTGLQVEVTLEDKKYILNSPASVYIPAGVKHTYRFLKGSGKYINIVLVPGGEYNKAVF
ncbi:MAG: hypothetical protein QXZ02_02105 [Candidatus Bathyarchaeia archaeon]